MASFCKKIEEIANFFSKVFFDQNLHLNLVAKVAFQQQKAILTTKTPQSTVISLIIQNLKNSL
ncbi:hypothetical protein DP117_19670 [Brasilonema sp. UFV-L1]|nr:hypothetical protein [Brasilonema sp. UFV-L1]